MNAGMIPDRWRFCGSYERIHVALARYISCKVIIPRPYNGKLNELPNEKLHYATTTDNEHNEKNPEPNATLQWKGRISNRLLGQDSVHTSHDPHSSTSRKPPLASLPT
jgi:hypothetical protein